MFRKLSRSLIIAVRLCCPRCGRGELFTGPFAMRERCHVCDLTFEREPGYFVGSIYINYSATVVLSVAGFLLLDSYTSLSLRTQLVIWGVFGVAFPLCFFRYSRSLWLGLDYLFNPEDPALRLVHGGRA